MAHKPMSDHSPRVLLLNGPPGCGKDQAAAFLKVQYPFLIEEKFSHPLKWAAQKVFGLSERELEAWKRESALPRQFQIGLSEQVIKPLFGPAWFGQACAERVLEKIEDGLSCFVVSDCGFRIEVEALVQALGPARVALWQIHRPGCSFAGDSRDWVELGSQIGETRVIANQGDLAQFKETVLANASELFAGTSKTWTMTL